MWYTIAVLKDVHDGLEVSLKSHGNKKVVSCHFEGELTSKEFDKTENAYLAFETLSKMIVFGTHSYEDRKAVLK